MHEREMKDVLFAQNISFKAYSMQCMGRYCLIQY